MNADRIHIDTSFEILANRLAAFRDDWQRAALGASYDDVVITQRLCDQTRKHVVEAFVRLIVATESAGCMTPPDDAEIDLSGAITDSLCDLFYDEHERVREYAEEARNERVAA